MRTFASAPLSLLQTIWLILAVVLVVDVIWITAAGFGFDWGLFTPVRIGGVMVMAAGAYASARIWPEPYVYLFIQSILVNVASAIVLSTVCYLATSVALPLQDARLVVVDHALGLNWLSYLAWVREHVWVQEPLRNCYISQGFEGFCVMWALVLMKRSQALLQYMLALVVALLICITVSMLIPAVGPYVFYDLYPEKMLRYSAVGRFSDYIALRDGSLHVIVLSKIQGLIAFPSFHSAVAVLTIWVARAMRWLYYPLVALNVAILVATPIFGGHYFTDVLGGFIVAGATIALVSRQAGKIVAGGQVRSYVK